MEWTEESISRLRALWQEGLSTAEIGRRMQISKNAVVGKAHRLTLPPRPSPIRKSPEGRVARPESIRPRAARPEPARLDPTRPAIAHPEAPRPDPVSVVSPQPPRPAAAEPAPSNVTAFPSAQVQALRPAAERSPLDALLAPAAPEETRAPSRPSAPEGEASLRRAAASAAPRRRGLTCCWPLGEPGTKDFHFCGGEPIPGKPYCSEHASLAYVKLRDRRDSVA